MFSGWCIRCEHRRDTAVQRKPGSSPLNFLRPPPSPRPTSWMVRKAVPSAWVAIWLQVVQEPSIALTACPVGGES